MNALAPIGRLLFSFIFILSGLNHFLQFETTKSYTAAAGLPFPGPATLVSGLVLLLGGLSVLLGYHARVGALLLAGFLLLSGLTVHAFWRYPDPMMAADQQIHFLKNLSMAGGALLLASFGAGPVSVDERRRPRRAPEVTGYRAPLRPRPQE